MSSVESGRHVTELFRKKRMNQRGSRNARRGVSRATMGAAMILVGLFIGSSLYVGLAFAADPATLTVQAPDHIDNGGTAQIQVHLQHASANTPYSVAIEVTPPTSPVNAGGPFCVTETVPTDNNGNGQVTVSYPDTGDPSALFQASACSPAGKGGPSSIVAGTYGVTVSTTGLAPASTSFIVLPPKHEVTGIGTASTATVSNPTFYPAACPAGTAGPCYQSCSGTPTTAPTTATAPYWSLNIGQVIVTGVISSVTPGVREVNNVISACGGTPTNPLIGTFTGSDTFSEVTVNPPDGDPIAGGVIVTYSGTSTFVVTSGTLASGTYTETVTSLAHATDTGTGGLAGMSGTSASITTTLVDATAGHPTTTTSSINYQVDLTNVPGT